MTAAQLIELLQTLPPRMVVYIPIDEENIYNVSEKYCEVREVKTYDGRYAKGFILRSAASEDGDDVPVGSGILNFPN